MYQNNKDEDGVHALLQVAATQSQICQLDKYIMTRTGIIYFLESLGSLVCGAFVPLSDGEQGFTLE